MGSASKFDFKICRYCGNKFQGDLDICDKCYDEFVTLEEELKKSKYSKYLKHCKYCGKPFISGKEITRKNTKYFQPYSMEYCNGINSDKIHFLQCQCCGGPVKESVSAGWPSKVGCSRKCTNAVWQTKLRATNLERYGDEVAIRSDAVQEKVKSTCRQRYGVDYVLQRSEIRDRIDEAMREKFGVESNVSQNPEVRKKITETVTKNYGGYTWASEELKEKCKQTSIEKYGTDFPQQSEEVKQKIVKSTREHYGVDHVMQSEDHRNRLIESCREKHGVDWINQLPEYRESSRQAGILRFANSIQDEEKRQNYLNFMKDPIAYVKTNFKEKPTMKEVKDSIGGLDEATIYGYLGVGTSSAILTRAMSTMERDVQRFIQSIVDTEIWMCNRSLLNNNDDKRREIDLYLPEYKIGIECNPTATHNCSHYYKDSDCCGLISKDYHKIKTDLAEKNGIFLFHLFGYEWIWKHDIMESMVRSLLNKNESKFHARNLQVCELNSYECKRFLDNNHRQGGIFSKIRLGLKTTGGELVSVMTFDKTRNTMGNSRSDTENTWELSRFCSLLNTTVVGGASKLFKYFLRNYEYDKIVSFSDRAHTRGTLYEILGFQKVNVSSPNYVWVNYKDDTYYNRVSCQKKNLPKLFDEPDLDIKNQTEKQIMMTHGYVQVFDSGTIRWEYTK